MVISASLQACGVVFPFAMLTSICRSIVTICSGLYLLIGMTRFSSKWILSHSTWYKFRRSGHGYRWVRATKSIVGAGDSDENLPLDLQENRLTDLQPITNYSDIRFSIGFAPWVAVFSFRGLRLTRRRQTVPRCLPYRTTA